MDAAAAVNDAAEGPDRGKRERLRGFQRGITNERTNERRKRGTGRRRSGDRHSSVVHSGEEGK